MEISCSCHFKCHEQFRYYQFSTDRSKNGACVKQSMVVFWILMPCYLVVGGSMFLRNNDNHTASQSRKPPLSLLMQVRTSVSHCMKQEYFMRCIVMGSNNIEGMDFFILKQHFKGSKTYEHTFQFRNIGHKISGKIDHAHE